MYRPSFFNVSAPSEAWKLVRDYPFAILFSAKSHLWATHLPLILVERYGQPHRLIGHLARGNRQWRWLKDGDEVLAVFKGPDAYLTPTLYTSEPDVPTWNYTATHITARWHQIRSEAQIRTLLEDTVVHFESRQGSDWTLEQLEESLVASLQADIVAFELEPVRVEGARKLSQDKTDTDRRNVATGLADANSENERAIAALIEEELEK